MQVRRQPLIAQSILSVRGGQKHEKKTQERVSY